VTVASSLLGILATITLALRANPAAALAACEHDKLVAAGKAARTIFKCHASALGQGAAVEPDCLVSADTRLAEEFVGAESSGPCPFTGEAATVASNLTSAAAAIAAGLAPPAGASNCSARKLKAGAKRSSKRLKAEAKHARVPERAKLAAKVAKIGDGFERDIAKADALADCVTTGDAAALGAALDGAAADVLDSVRGNLAALAATGGRLLGAAARADVLASSEPDYHALLARQFSSVTLESEFMWGNIEPSPGSYNLAPVEETLGFAEANGMHVVGLPLVWHLILPSWVNGAMTPAALQQALDDRIDTLVGGYAGRVDAWVVVNEAVSDFGGLRSSIFLNKLGSGYIADAFHRARAADPDALLFYNDYLAEGSGPKSDFIYAMVVDLLAQGVPIDGIGLQTHLGGLFAPFGQIMPVQMQQNIQRFVDLGLQVAITEMDVQVAMVSEDTSERLATQRSIYHDVVAQCLAVNGCSSISFWGFTDKYTWIEDYLMLDDDPLPWDASYLAKAAFFGVRDALLGQ
jgi:endo-1,4-beta-xylanase